MFKKLVSVRGMHCRSCEILVEKELKNIPGVQSVDVSFRKGVAEVRSEKEIQDNLIDRAVRSAGYSVGADEKRSWISHDPNQYKDLFSALIFLVFAYLVLRMFGLTEIDVNFSKPSNLLVVLLIGLTAGISTCMALVGGLIASISARHAEKHPEATVIQKFRPHIYFNVSRIISYAVLGGFIGLAGQIFQFSSTSLGALTLAVGFVMLVLGLQLIEIFPRVSRFSITVPASVGKVLGVGRGHEKEYSHVDSVILGFVSFFLPCGFTQAMQVYAISTGSFVSGALVMGVFALGTAPGLLGIGGIISAIRGSFSKKFFKFVGLVVISLAIFNMANAFSLFGLKLSWPSFGASTSGNDIQSKAEDPNVKIEDGVQVVRMTEDSRGYSPNTFTIKKGIPVKWIINATNIYSCASSFVVPSMGISTTLRSGENIFEFVPDKVGEIRFSCSMGMYRGKFIVTEDGKVSLGSNNLEDVDEGIFSGASCHSGGGGCDGCGGGI